jgi:hypothetical protein
MTKRVHKQTEPVDVADALRQLRGIVALIEAGELKATPTERAHMNGALEILEQISRTSVQ